MVTIAEYEKICQRVINQFNLANIVLSPAEQKSVEVTDFGLNCWADIGLQIVTYINSARCCAKEMSLFPWQTCPEHYHPTINGILGKEETFRCRWGEVYLYVPGPATGYMKAKMHDALQDTLSVWHEVTLHPGEQYQIEPGTKHWFQGGPEGAIISEFSTTSNDDTDIFTDTKIVRLPEIH